MAVKRRSPARTATVRATDAAKNFGAIVDRVREAGVAYVVERKGRPIARIAPMTERRCTIGELAAWLADRRPGSDEYGIAVGAHVKAANRPRVPTTRWPS
jgi:antitoxin (DNA-binding transcriptional repressor) of toxin-antitoxin stability system